MVYQQAEEITKNKNKQKPPDRSSRIFLHNTPRFVRIFSPPNPFQSVKGWEDPTEETIVHASLVLFRGSCELATFVADTESGVSLFYTRRRQCDESASVFNPFTAAICHLKATSKSAKFETVKPFCLLVKGFYQNA